MNATMSATPIASPSSLLSRMLALDAATCVISGLVLLAGSGWLSPLLGLPTNLLMPAGVVLLVFATLILAATSQPARSRGLVWAIIVGNLLWFDASLLVAFLWYEPTPLGLVVVVAQAVAVLGITLLEFIGLRRLRP